MQPDAGNGMEAVRMMRNHKSAIVGEKAQAEYLMRLYNHVRDKFEEATQRIDPDAVGSRFMWTFAMSSKAWRNNKHLKIASSRELSVRPSALSVSAVKRLFAQKSLQTADAARWPRLCAAVWSASLAPVCW